MPLPFENSSPLGTGKRDRSRFPAGKADKIQSAATIRKARQRAMRAKDGFKRLELDLPLHCLAFLEDAATLAGDGLKNEAQQILVACARKNFDEILLLSKRASTAWAKAKPYLPYLNHFQKSHLPVRVRDFTATHEEWCAIYRELCDIENLLVKRGWSSKRAQLFIQDADKRLARLRR